MFTNQLVGANQIMNCFREKSFTDRDLPDKSQRRRLPMGRGSETKEKILAASLEIFSRQGYDGARMDGIAAQVGINKASLYFHFASKEEIFRVLFAQIVETYGREVARIFNDAKALPVRDRLVAIARSYLLYHWKNTEMDFWNAVFYYPPQTMREEILAATDASKTDLQDRLTAVMEEGIAEGVFGQVPARSLAMSFYYVLTCISISMDMMDKDEALRNMEACFDAFWNGAARR